MSNIVKLLDDAQNIIEANRVLAQRLASETDPTNLKKLKKDWASNAGMLRTIGGQLEDVIEGDG